MATLNHSKGVTHSQPRNMPVCSWTKKTVLIWMFGVVSGPPIARPRIYANANSFLRFFFVAAVELLRFFFYGGKMLFTFQRNGTLPLHWHGIHSDHVLRAFPFPTFFLRFFFAASHWRRRRQCGMLCFSGTLEFDLLWNGSRILLSSNFYGSRCFAAQMNHSRMTHWEWRSL